jgi:hypothetical protein
LRSNPKKTHDVIHQWSVVNGQWSMLNDLRGQPDTAVNRTE